MSHSLCLNLPPLFNLWNYLWPHGRPRNELRRLTASAASTSHRGADGCADAGATSSEIKEKKKRERKSWAGAEKYPSWSSSLWREDTLRIHSLCRIADSESFYSWLWRDRRSSSSGASFWFLLQIRWVCLRQKERGEAKTFNCYYFLFINSEVSLLWNNFSDKPPDQRDALLFSPDYLSSPLSLERMRCRWVKHELSENQS